MTAGTRLRFRPCSNDNCCLPWGPLASLVYKNGVCAKIDSCYVLQGRACPRVLVYDNPTTFQWPWLTSCMQDVRRPSEGWWNAVERGHACASLGTVLQDVGFSKQCKPDSMIAATGAAAACVAAGSCDTLNTADPRPDWCWHNSRGVGRTSTRSKLHTHT